MLINLINRVVYKSVTKLVAMVDTAVVQREVINHYKTNEAFANMQQGLAEEVAQHVNTEELAEKLVGEVAESINAEDIANYIDADEVAQHIDYDIDYSDLASELDYDTIAESIDASDVADNFGYYKLSEIAEHLDVDNLAEHIDLDDLQRHIDYDKLTPDPDTVATIVQENKPFRIKLLESLQENEVFMQGLTNRLAERVKEAVGDTGTGIELDKAPLAVTERVVERAAQLLLEHAEAYYTSEANGTDTAAQQ